MSLGSKCYPLKTNMTGWKIHTWMKTRYISYWTWGFSNVMLVFRGVPSLTLTLRPICVVNIYTIQMGKMVPYHVFCECSRVKNLQLSMPETTLFLPSLAGGRSGSALRSRSTGSRTAEAGAVLQTRWRGEKTWSETIEIWRWPFWENHWVQWKNDNPPEFPKFTAVFLLFEPMMSWEDRVGDVTWYSWQLRFWYLIWAPRNWLRSPWFEPSGVEI